jgi:hypothetical protein
MSRTVRPYKSHVGSHSQWHFTDDLGIRMATASRNFQRRFANARPGLQLIAVEDAAIPVTVVRADVLAQEKKELPIKSTASRSTESKPSNA